MKPSDRNKYNFFLNTYVDAAFTKSILNLNKTCKYCPYCELIIARKCELDQIIGKFLGVDKVREKDYFVLGTQEKSAYLAGLNKGFIYQLTPHTPPLLPLSAVPAPC